MNPPEELMDRSRPSATSITSLILTTEALVADKPEKAAPSAGGGGSHDYDM